MDINVICASKDQFFRLAVLKVIEGIVSPGATVKFLTGSDCLNLKQADFIIINESQWRFSMCQLDYRHRKPGVMIIIFSGDNRYLEKEDFPLCYQSIIFFSRADSVHKISQVLKEHWFSIRVNERGYLFTDCLCCPFSYVTTPQLRVIRLLRIGYSIERAAKLLDLSIKTVYSHKYNVMKNFSLKGDAEFYNFINELSLTELHTGILGAHNN